ncbi:hypothetical protein P3T76_014348 [Phytophthora citrophthora]|uniref:RxLR effector protein n=1 Tax=Phytophthora citrophthora TaxID=4793 RepID=A0AAD9LCB4_9STRA|nr:hypothetical protein P3T76_014348 [Phytophthora citrophthora]
MRLSQILVIAVASFLFASDTVAAATSNQAKISKMAQGNPSQRNLRGNKYLVEEEEDQSEDSVDVEERGYTTHDEEDLEERGPLSSIQVDKLDAIARGWGTTYERVAMGLSSISKEKATALLNLRDAYIKSKARSIDKANTKILHLNSS